MLAKPGESPSSGDSVRSIVRWKARASSAAPDGGEKRRPLRIRNVYVRPSADRAGMATAASGRNRCPAAPAASG
jgi:hypothetical protein